VLAGDKIRNVYRMAAEANPEKEFIGFTSLEALHNSKSQLLCYPQAAASII